MDETGKPLILSVKSLLNILEFSAGMHSLARIFLHFFAYCLGGVGLPCTGWLQTSDIILSGGRQSGDSITDRWSKVV
jgi:hypothetical protein